MVEEKLNYKRLRELLRDERDSPILTPLPENFMEKIEEFLSEKFNEIEKNRSILEMREIENTIAIIKEICAIRNQKIILKALRSRGKEKVEGLMDREYRVYNDFCNIIENSESELENFLNKYTQKNITEKMQTQQLKKVRIIKEVPLYKGPNNQTYGPYAPGEERELPISEASWLIKVKLAEEV
jgi:DNA replication initiation complex subunit (GINS family)